MKAIAIIFAKTNVNTLKISITGMGWHTTIMWDYVKYPEKAYCRKVPKIEGLGFDECRAVVQIQSVCALKQALAGKTPSVCVLVPITIHIIPQIAAIQAEGE